MLDIIGVEKTFNPGTVNEKKALKNINLTLEDGDFVTAANELIKKSNMTVDQAQAYFNSLGYEPEFEVETKKVRRSVPQTTTHTDYKITSGYVDIMGAKVPIPTIDRTETSWVSGYKDIEDRKVTKPLKGHFDKAGVGYKRFLREFKLEDSASMNIGDEIKVAAENGIDFVLNVIL